MTADTTSTRFPWFPVAQPWVSLVARLGLAFMWLWYSIPKISHEDDVVKATRNFDMLPEWAVKPWAYSMPYIEVAFALLLVIGLATRWTAVLSALLLLAFIVGFVQLWVRGINLSNCGCSGGVSEVIGGPPNYTWDITRDVLFMIPAIWLIVFPVSKISFDPFAPLDDA